MKHLNALELELVKKAKELAQEERRITAALIETLREIDQRMIYTQLGYSSLFEFACQELKLSEGAAHRRVQAARLLRDVPEVKEQLAEGSLSLSNAARIQSFCRAVKMAPEKKRQIVERAQNLSQVQCLKTLFEISPQAISQERERVISPSERELRWVVSEEVYQKLETLRGMLAHALPEAKLSELLEHLLDLGIAEQQKKRVGAKNLKSMKSTGTPGTEDPAPKGEEPKKPELSFSIHPAAGSTKALPSGKRVYLPKTETAPPWIRAQNQCEFTDSNGKRCSSRYRLQVDHIQPLSQGGANTSANLRILCWAHNVARNH